MTVATGNITGLVADFVIGAVPPPLARQRAGVATCDTIGVALAGVPEPAAEIVRATATTDVNWSMSTHRNGCACQCQRGGVGKRRRGSCARLR